MESTGARILIGTSGYSYPGAPPKGWYGVFYPRPSPKRFHELEYYSRFFDAVEINTSFYRPPAPAMAKSWTGKTPAGFEFSVKAWQKFTHERKIGEDSGPGGATWDKPDRADVDLFRAGIEPLEQSGKLGVLLFQYPMGFHYSRSSLERLRWTLEAFRGYPKAVELRHRSWSERGGEVHSRLLELGSSWAIIDEPKFPDSVRQEFAAPGDPLYFRAHGRNAKSWFSPAESWMRYDYCYSREEIGQIAAGIKRLVAQNGGRRKVFVFFNNHARGQSVVNALMMSHAMGIAIESSPGSALLDAFPQLGAIVPKAPRERLL